MIKKCLKSSDSNSFKGGVKLKSLALALFAPLFLSGAAGASELADVNERINSMAVRSESAGARQLVLNADKLDSSHTLEIAINNNSLALGGRGGSLTGAAAGVNNISSPSEGRLGEVLSRKGIPTGFAGELTPTLDAMQTNATSILPTASTYFGTTYALTEITDPSMDLTGKTVVAFNGKRYYYTTPTTLTSEKFNMLNYLSGSTAVALTSAGATAANAVFSISGTNYTFDTTKLPTSVYTLTPGSEGAYDIKTTDGTTTNYYNFNFDNTKITKNALAQVSAGTDSDYDFAVRLSDHSTKYYNIAIDPTKASSVGSKLSNINWSTEAPSGYTWANDNNVAGSNVTVNTTAGTVSGAIRMKMPHKGTVPAADSWNRYFTYTYTKPAGYEFVANNSYTVSTSAAGSDSEYKVATDGRSATNVITNAVDSTIASITNKTYANNVLTANFSHDYNIIGGGAILNQGTIGDVVADFVGNRISSTTGSWNRIIMGGAIANVGVTSGKTANINSITGDFVGNSSSSSSAYGGAISNYANSGTASIGSIVGDFIGNSSSGPNSFGGAISNYANSGTASIGSIVGDFIGNSSSGSSSSRGGAIANYANSGTASIGSIVGDFIGNSSSSSNYSYGGAISNYANSGTASIGSIVGDFVGNSSSSGNYSYGGAISNYAYNSTASIGSIVGDFVGNSSISYGGAIYNYASSGSTASIGSIVGDFVGNSSYGAYGGAISNYVDSGTASIGSIVGDFVGNFSISNGGAIFNSAQNSGSTASIGSITGDFVGNSVSSSSSSYGAYGGAIYSYIPADYYTGATSVNSSNSIISITGDFVGNSASRGGAIYLSEYSKTNKVEEFTLLHNNSIQNINGDFIGNSATATSSDGGAIYIGSESYLALQRSASQTATLNADINLQIRNINGDFIRNYAQDTSGGANGGAIAISIKPRISKYHPTQTLNVSLIGEIQNITGDFVDNYASSSSSSAYGGAIFNSAQNSGSTASIGSITGDFVGNSASGSYSSGGAIYNNANNTASATIGSIVGHFVGNSSSSSSSAYGGAIYNNAPGSSATASIGSIVGDFVGNSASSSSSSAYGGAIFNGSSPTSYSSGSVITLAGNTFTGNYVQVGENKTPNSIYNAGVINIKNGATVTINDGWQSLSQAQLVMGSGSTLNMNIANGTIQADSLGKFTKNGTFNATFDIDFNGGTGGVGSGDSISTTGITLSDESGIVTVNGFNFLNGTSGINKNTKIQLLKTQANGLKLVLSPEAAAQLPAGEFVIGTIAPSDVPETIAAATAWDKNYQRTVTTAGTIYGTIGLATTTTTDDSIGVTQTRQEGGVTTHESMGDTLKLVNQATNNPTKTFTAGAQGATYTVTDNLGATKGTVNINGISGGNAETVNLNGNTGFELGTGATALKFNNVTVGSSTATNPTIATVTNNSATIGLNNTILNGSISGSGYSITTTGNTTINGTVGGNLTNTGTLNSTLANLTGTFTNNGTFNLGGQLTKDISGAGTTVLTEDQTIGVDRTVQGILNVNGQTLGMSDSAYKTLTVGNLTGNGNLTLNADATSTIGTSDTIHINNNTGLNSVLTITALNLTTPTVDAGQTKTSTMQVLTGNTNGVSLALSTDVSNQYNTVNTVTNTGTDYLNTNEIRWDANFGGWKQEETTTQTLAVSSDTALSYTINKTLGDKVYTSKAENLAIMNTYTGTGSADRSIDFTGIHAATATGTYVVKAALGASSAGKMTLEGDVGDSNTTVDLHGNAGFTLSNATELVLDKINLKDSLNTSATLITVSNNGADITLNNTNVQGAITATGGATYDITATNTNSLQNVTGARVANSGNLTLNGTNNLVNMTNAAGTTEIKSGTTTVGNVDQKSVTVDSGATKLVVTNGIKTTDGVTNNKQNGLEIQGGTINSNISGASGSTTINTTGTVSLTDGKEISQAINLAAGTFNTNAGGIKGGLSVTTGNVELTGGELTTAITGGTITISTGEVTSTVENLAGTITNNSTLNLSGTLAKAIGGANGTTKVNTALTLNEGASVEGILNLNNGAVTVSAGSTTNHNIGALEGKADFAIDYNTATGDIDTLTLANDTVTEAIVNVTSLDIGSTPIANLNDFTAQVLINAKPNTKLTISEVLKEQFEKTYTEDKSVSHELTSPTIKWNDKYGTEEWTETYKAELGVNDVGDSIEYKSTKTSETEHIWNPEADNLALINQYAGTGSDNRTFNFDSKEDVYKVKENVGSTTSGELSVIGKAGTKIVDGKEVRETSTIDFQNHDGFNMNNDDTTLTLKDVGVQNANFLVKSANESSVINLDGVTLKDNGDGIRTSGTVNITGKSDIQDKVLLTGDSASINVKDSDDVKINSRLYGMGSLNVENSTLSMGKDTKILGLDTTFNNSKLNLESESSLSGVNTTFSGTNNLNASNGSVGNLAFGNLNLNGLLRMQIDADLANKQMDKLMANSVSLGNNAKIDVSKINLLSPTTEQNVKLLFTNNKDLARIVNYTGEDTIVYSPIYKYKTNYEINKDMGYFSFASAGGSDGFNPSVLSTPVMAQAGMQANMNATMNYAFQHSDGFTKLRAMDRFAAINANKYALNDSQATGTRGAISTDFNQNLANLANSYENKGAWFRPYVSFENVNLKNGPRVDAISFGSLAGFDTNFKELKHGWNTVFTGYLGYNGAHLNYKGVSTMMNGGVIGGTQTWYKGNFWTALTATTGASVAESDTMYGHESNASIMAGVGSKTGYNFEFKQGRFIIQPIWFMNYSMIKTFDYTNAAGVRINSDPLHTIQLNPSVRFIGNLNHGWQPYASVGMVWNLMNETQARANGVKLPEMSVKPYVEYGVGVQKQVGDRFTGFFQAMMRNGGRNGIALTGGFRWALGRDSSSKPKEKVMTPDLPLQDANAKNQFSTNRKVLKQVRSDRNVQNNISNDKKVLKSLSTRKSMK